MVRFCCSAMVFQQERKKTGHNDTRGEKNRLQEHICRNWIRNYTYNATGRMKYDIEKTMVFSVTTYPFTRNRSSFTYQRSIKCLVSVHDVFNRGFVIPPWTGILRVCLSPKRQNLTNLASGEKWFLFRVCLKDNTCLIIWVYIYTK